MISPVRRGSGVNGEEREPTEPAHGEIDKGNQPNVQTVTSLLSEESDLSYTPEQDSIFGKLFKLGVYISRTPRCTNSIMIPLEDMSSSHEDWIDKGLV